MRKLITTMMGLMLLGGILSSTGCAPVPYQETYYVETEIILVPVPIPVPAPYPEPVEVGRSDPPPRRKAPLTKPRDSGNPRTKNPAHEQRSRNPVVARSGAGSGSEPSKASGRPTKRPGPKRR